MADGDGQGRGETLEELLADPIVWLIMRSDGVTSQEISEVLRNACRRLDGNSDSARVKRGDDGDGSYRPGVGMLVLNARNEVLVGRRNDLRDEVWQMPQGGIDKGESPQEAAYRELKEEIGSDNVEVLAETRDWLYYNFPDDLVRTAWNGQWRGQRQKWFVMRFKGRDADITVDTEHPEFSDWKWAKIEELETLVVSFKRNVYLSLLAEFEAVVTPRSDSRSA